MQTKALFSNIARELAELLRASTTEITVAVAWFTDPELFEILCGQARKGVRVRLAVLDDEINRRQNGGGLDFQRLRSLRGEVALIPSSDREAIMHHKFCVIDDATVIVGSYNWTCRAQQNDENVVIITGDEALADRHRTAFDELVARMQIAEDSPDPTGFDWSTDSGDSRARLSRIIKQMVREASEWAQSEGSWAIGNTTRFDDLRLREPDYRQMMRWAAEAEKTPELLVYDLRKSAEESIDYPRGDAIVSKDGVIVALTVNLALLPRIPEDWELGMQLRILRAYANPWKYAYNPLPSAFRPGPRSLKFLKYSGKLKSLDLSMVPLLTELDCSENNLAVLDLSPVPLLTELDCRQNNLGVLDLSPVPLLRKLNCDFNELQELDLAAVSGLTALSCTNNYLNVLDLSLLRNLSVLECNRNHLGSLDLSPVLQLSVLNCSTSDLSVLDLSPVPNLLQLNCFSSKLVKLIVPLDSHLTEICCAENYVTELDLCGAPGLIMLDCRRNALHALRFSPRSMLKEFDCSDNYLPGLDLSRLSELEKLYCGWNELTDLNLSCVPKLKKLICDERVRILFAPSHLDITRTGPRPLPQVIYF